MPIKGLSSLSIAISAQSRISLARKTVVAPIFRQMCSNAKPTSTQSWYKVREKREEAYKALNTIPGFVAALALLWAINEHQLDVEERRVARRAQLGRELVHEVESKKTELKLVMRKFDTSKEGEKEALEKIELTFGYVLRYLSSYDTEIIPELLKIETEYQLQRLRKLSEMYADKKNDQIKSNIKECLFDIYEVINIASVIASASTTKKELMTEDEKAVYDKFHSGVKTIDEIRTLTYSPVKIRQFENLHESKSMFWKANPSVTRVECFRESVNFDFSKSVRSSSKNPR